jgi:tetratricopeptide (TPR) repeat protein
MAEDACDEPPSGPAEPPYTASWPWILGLLAVTTVAFLPMLDAGLTNWDDEGYVLSNPYLGDLSWDGIRALFGSYYKGNYHPLSMLSLSVDHRIGGLSPRVYHASNLALHLANTLLVFALARRLLQSLPGGFIAALLFGVHPLHVESVAWVSERKDVLYTLFYLLSLLAYLRCLDRADGRQRFYTLSLVAFVLSLLSKGQAVALAPSLFALDLLRGRDLRKLHVWIEKVPYFALALGFGIVALGAQSGSGQLQGVSQWSVLERLALASSGYLQYLLKLALPLNLSAFYPYPERIEGSLPALYWLAPLGVAGVAGLFAWSVRHARVLAFGIAFFTANVVFVLQLVPVGGAIIADRYSYVASIGLFVPLAAGAIALYERRQPLGVAALVALAIYSAALAVATHRRTGVWHDSLTLWDDVITKHRGIDIAHLNRALARYGAGDLRGAEDDLSEAIRISPEYGRAWAHRGVVRHQLGDTQAGLGDLTRALVFEPSAENHSNRGSLRLAAGNNAGAIADFDRALAMRPGYVMAWNNRGHARAAAGDPKRALADFQQAAALAPGLISAWLGSGEAQLALGDPAGAERSFDMALRLDPGSGPGHLGRGLSRVGLGNRGPACEDLYEAVRSRTEGAAAAASEHCAGGPHGTDSRGSQ